MNSFDPDVIDNPMYDDRAPRVEKVVNEVIRTRNRGNRQRGKKTERLWAEAINKALDDAGLTEFERAVSKGGVGGADVIWAVYAFECKHRHMGWPSNTVIKKALVQAVTNAGNRTPIVISCMTTHNKREWRYYIDINRGFDRPVTLVYMDAMDWLRERVAELKA